VVIGFSWLYIYFKGEYAGFIIFKVELLSQLSLANFQPIACL